MGGPQSKDLLRRYGGNIQDEKIVLREAIIEPGTHLRRCEVQMVDAKLGLVDAAELENCTLVAPKRLRNYSWGYATLRGCRFTGWFDCNDFGSGPSLEEKGRVVGCDFAEAKLFGCRFFDVDAGANGFGGWPQFLVFPDRLAGKVDRVPSQLRNFFRPVEGLSFYVYDAELLAKESGVALSEIARLFAQLT